jgi:DNA-binding CsgD family transcriptional regulator
MTRKLSANNRAVLAYAAEGYSRQETADLLNLSLYSVRGRLAKCRRVLGARTIIQALAIADQQGLLPATKEDR